MSCGVWWARWVPELYPSGASALQMQLVPLKHSVGSAIAGLHTCACGTYYYFLQINSVASGYVGYDDFANNLVLQDAFGKNVKNPPLTRLPVSCHDVFLVLFG